MFIEENQGIILLKIITNKKTGLNMKRSAEEQWIGSLRIPRPTRGREGPVGPEGPVGQQGSVGPEGPTRPIVTISRLFVGYSDTQITPLTQNIWTIFTNPTTLITYRTSGDWSTSTSNLRFTFTGITGKWFLILVNCNIVCDSQGANRTVEFAWRKNGTEYGHIRSAYMNSADSIIISGSGYGFLAPGDYFEPWFRNTENSDDVKITNCSFIFEESPDTRYST